EKGDAVIELVGLSEHSVHFSSAVQAFGNRYKPGEQLAYIPQGRGFNCRLSVIGPHWWLIYKHICRHSLSIKGLS
ncbi:E3 SUMO-protein ligase MMS21, partial [Trifolium medium]|nr:E3 SUMO-protein ligase MMS21 [Trifolium medium]